MTLQKLRQAENRLRNAITSLEYIQTHDLGEANEQIPPDVYTRLSEMLYQGGKAYHQLRQFLKQREAGKPLRKLERNLERNS